MRQRADSLGIRYYLFRMRTLTGTERDYALISLFLSAYENYAWRGAVQQHPELETPGGVETIATRSDGTRLAFEHTLIEPFAGDRADTAKLQHWLLPLEKDESLRVTNAYLDVRVPAFLLQHGRDWKQIVDDLRRFLESIASTARAAGPTDTRVIATFTQESCPTSGIPDAVSFNVAFRIQGIADYDGPPALIRRIADIDARGVIDKALNSKLTKLVAVEGAKKILLLEMNQWNMNAEMFNAELRRRQQDFPNLSKVDEVWFVDSMGYPTLTDYSHFRADGNEDSYIFSHNRLIGRHWNGYATAFDPPPTEIAS